MKVLWLSTIILLTDQVTKLLVKGIEIPFLGLSVQGMSYGASKPILGDFFRLTYIENPGMAFGIDIGGKLFFSIFSILASVAIILYLYRIRTESLGFRISLAMILGGAIGNLVDRVFYGVIFDEAPLFYGRVVDFFDVDFFDINLWGYTLNRWPVFNIADASVTIGVLTLLIFQGRSSEKKSQEIIPGGSLQRVETTPAAEVQSISGEKELSPDPPPESR